jgi:hypothetical protein
MRRERLERIQAAIEQVLTRPDHTEARIVLEREGPFAIDPLLRVLDDPRATEPYPGGTHGRPLRTLADLLRMTPAALPAMLRLLAHPEPEARAAAAFHLGERGHRTCLDGILRALADPAGPVREKAVMGLSNARHDGRLTPDAVERLHEPIARLLTDDAAYATARDAARILLQLDPARGVAEIRARDAIAPARGTADRILDAANDLGVALPLPEIRALVTAWAPSFPQKGPRYVDACIALAIARAPEAAQVARDAIEAVRRHAAGGGWNEPFLVPELRRAVEMATGRNNPIDELTRRVYQDGGFDTLSPLQQHAWAVHTFDFHATREGLTDVFSYGHPHLALSALAGFEALGLAAHADVAHRLLALFGPDGPPDDPDAFHPAFLRVLQEHESALEALQQDYPVDSVAVELRLTQLFDDHADEFAPRRPRKRGRSS